MSGARRDHVGIFNECPNGLDRKRQRESYQHCLHHAHPNEFVRLFDHPHPHRPYDGDNREGGKQGERDQGSTLRLKSLNYEV